MKKELKLFHLGKNIRLKERMLLIYIIGGIIPFIVATLFLHYRSQEIIIEQNREAQREELSLLCSELRESMGVAEDVAVQIYNDPVVVGVVSRVMQKEYKDTESFVEDCQGLEFIDKYTQYYKNEIADIRIYITNETIKPNKYFRYIGSEDMKKLFWYVPTCEREGRNYWAYAYDEVEMAKKVPQLSRTIQDGEGNIVGVLAIQLASTKTTEKILQRDIDTALFYKGEMVVSNFSSKGLYQDIIQDFWSLAGTRGTKVITHEVKEYLMAYEWIYSNTSGMCFMAASIQEYRSLLSDYNRSYYISVGIIIIGLLISSILLVIFSMIFNERIQMLRTQMHYVAVGEYEKVAPIDGNDEIALLYQELGQMMEDIKELTNRVAREEVQKEKLHTQQKEMEFKVLAGQINPHFLYNTLETIRMKAKINRQQEIEELVKMLAKIMRRNIQVGDNMVTLQSEIELIRNYLTIQSYRFGDRIRYELVVEDDVDTGIMVVPLIMQPFVENAYVHGLEAKESDGLLQIHIMRMGKEVVIKISDNGSGMSHYRLAVIRKSLHEEKPFEQGHIGISNVNQRLRILYGEKYGVTIQSELDRGTCITILFPAEAESSTVSDGESG